MSRPDQPRVPNEACRLVELHHLSVFAHVAQDGHQPAAYVLSARPPARPTLCVQETPQSICCVASPFCPIQRPPQVSEAPCLPRPASHTHQPTTKEANKPHCPTIHLQRVPGTLIVLEGLAEAERQAASKAGVGCRHCPHSAPTFLDQPAPSLKCLFFD